MIATPDPAPARQLADAPLGLLGSSTALACSAARAREVRMIETRRCAASARGRAPWRLALLAALALSLFGCAAPAASPAPPAGGAPAPAAGAPAAPAAAPAASSPGPAAAALQSITLAITSPTALYWP